MVGIDHGRVESELDVVARPRVRVPLDDVEPREERRAVQRARDLARPAAEAVDQLALRDDRRDPVAVRLVARADRAVEVERLPRQHHRPVELRGREPQVVGAVVRLLVRGVPGLEVAEHLVELHVPELRRLEARLDHLDRRVDRVFPAPERRVDARDRAVHVEPVPHLLGHEHLLLEVDVRVLRGRIQLALELQQLRRRGVGVDHDRERHVEGLPGLLLAVLAPHGALFPQGLAHEVGEPHPIDLHAERAAPQLAGGAAREAHGDLAVGVAAHQIERVGRGVALERHVLPGDAQDGRRLGLLLVLLRGGDDEVRDPEPRGDEDRRHGQEPLHLGRDRHGRPSWKARRGGSSERWVLPAAVSPW